MALLFDKFDNLQDLKTHIEKEYMSYRSITV